MSINKSMDVETYMKMNHDFKFADDDPNRCYRKFEGCLYTGVYCDIDCDTGSWRIFIAYPSHQHTVYNGFIPNKWFLKQIINNTELSYIL